MKEKTLLAANILLFAMATLILASIQTSLWFQIFGYFRGPALWIPVLIYIALFRSTLEAVIFSYITGFVLSTMTAMPEGTLIAVCLGLALTTQALKQRIFWSSASYIMMACGIAALAFHIFHWSATYFLEETPITSPQLLDWLIEALLTPLAAPPLFVVFRWFDRITGRENSSELSAQTL